MTINNTYRRITISKVLGTSLSFQIPFEGDYVVYNINELMTTISEAGLNLPDPVSAENGTSFILRNISNVTIKIFDSTQTTVILEMPTGTSYEFYVISNSNRQWGFVQLVGDPRAIITSFTIQDPRSNGKLIIQNGTVTPNTTDPVNISLPDSLANLSISTYTGFVYSRYASGIQTLVPLAFSSDSNIIVTPSIDTGYCTFSLNNTLQHLTSISTYGTKIETNIISATTGDLYLKSLTSQSSPTFIHLNPITIDTLGNMLNVNNLTVNGSLVYNTQDITSTTSISGTDNADLLIRSEEGFEVSINGVSFDKDQNITNIQSISSSETPTPEVLTLNDISVDHSANILNVSSISNDASKTFNANGLFIKAPTTSIPWVIISPDPSKTDQLIDIISPANLRLNGVTIDDSQNISNVTNLTITGQLTAPNFGIGGITFNNNTIISTASSNLTLISDQKVLVNGIMIDGTKSMSGISSLIGSATADLSVASLGNYSLKLNDVIINQSQVISNVSAISALTNSSGLGVDFNGLVVTNYPTTPSQLIPYVSLTTQTTSQELRITSVAKASLNGISFDTLQNITALNSVNGLSIVNSGSTIPFSININPVETSRQLSLTSPQGVLVNGVKFDADQNITNVKTINGNVTFLGNLTVNGSTTFGEDGIPVAAGLIPKAWCKFSVQYMPATSSYVITIAGSAGVSSITTPTLGTYKVTLINQMKNGDYAVFPSLMKTNVSNFTTQIVVTSQSPTDFSIQCLDPQNNLVQPAEAIYLMVMGDAL